MISLISIKEFVDKIYPPVHDRRTMYACKLVKALRSVGITDLKTLVHHTPEALTAIRHIGPVFVAQTEFHLAKIGYTLGMTDADLKKALLPKL